MQREKQTSKARENNQTAKPDTYRERRTSKARENTQPAKPDKYRESYRQVKPEKTNKQQSQTNTARETNK